MFLLSIHFHSFPYDCCACIFFRYASDCGRSCSAPHPYHKHSARSLRYKNNSLLNGSLHNYNTDFRRLVYIAEYLLCKRCCSVTCAMSREKIQCSVVNHIVYDQQASSKIERKTSSSRSALFLM